MYKVSRKSFLEGKFMAFKKTRNMKVYEQSGYQYKASYVDAFEERQISMVAEEKGGYR